MSRKLQLIRGLKADMPLLSVGELAYTTDTKELFVGTSTDNKRIAMEVDIQDIETIISTLETQISDIESQIVGVVTTTDEILDNPIPRDADTLGGYSPSHYAKQEDVNSILSDYMRYGISGVTTGSNTDYILNLINPLTSYERGLRVTILIHSTNASSATLNIDGLGAINLKKNDGSSFSSGELIENIPYTFVFNGIDFLAHSSGGFRISGQSEVSAKFLENIERYSAVYLEGIYSSNILKKLKDLNGSILADSYVSAASKDNEYLAVAHNSTGFICFFKRYGDFFEKLPIPAQVPTGSVTGIAFSPDGIYVAVSNGSSQPFLRIYKRNGDVFTLLAPPATLPPGTGRKVLFSNDGSYLVVGISGSPYMYIYKRIGDVFEKLNTPDVLPTNYINGMAFSNDDKYLSVSTDVSPYVIIYKRTGDSFVKLANPASLPSGAGKGVDFSPDGLHLVVAHQGTPYITIYKRTDDLFAKLPNPNVEPSSNSNAVSFSPEGNSFVTTHDYSPFISVYQKDGDVFSKLPNPDVLPTGIPVDIKHSLDGRFIFISQVGAPFFSIYIRNLIGFKAVKSNNDINEILNSVGGGYAKESGMAGETKKIVKIW